MPRLYDLEVEKMYNFYNEVVIGSDENCEIVLKENKTVSDRHAEIFEKEGKFYLRDLDSKKRTKVKVYGDNFVMSIELSSYIPVELHNGNEILIGSYKMRLID